MEMKEPVFPSTAAVYAEVMGGAPPEHRGESLLDWVHGAREGHPTFGLQRASEDPTKWNLVLVLDSHLSNRHVTVMVPGDPIDVVRVETSTLLRVKMFAISEFVDSCAEVHWEALEAAKDLADKVTWESMEEMYRVALEENVMDESGLGWLRDVGVDAEPSQPEIEQEQIPDVFEVAQQPEIRKQCQAYRNAAYRFSQTFPKGINKKEVPAISEVWTVDKVIS